MINSHPTLFLEINNKNLIFIVGKTDQHAQTEAIDHPSASCVRAERRAERCYN